VLGGLAMFVWGFVSHVVIGTTDHALQSMPAAREHEVVEQLSQLPGPGMYIYPTLGLRMGSKDAEGMKRLDEALKTSPNGIITVAAPAGGMMPPRKLVFQLLSDMLAAMIAGIALAIARIPKYGTRVFFVALLGLFAGFMVSLPYWNWYGFPTNYTVPEIFDLAIRGAAGGLVLGAFIKPS
jgi:hypothetical protein